MTRDILKSVRSTENRQDDGQRSYTQYDAPNLPSKSSDRRGGRRPLGLDELFFGVPRERIVRFDDSSDLSAMAGKPVRLKVRMKDANLYSIQFQE